MPQNAGCKEYMGEILDIKDKPPPIPIERKKLHGALIHSNEKLVLQKMNT